jgi:hypothetical protein
MPNGNSAVTKQTFLQDGYVWKTKSVGFNHAFGWFVTARQSTYAVMFTFLGKTITLSIKPIYKED